MAHQDNGSGMRWELDREGPMSEENPWIFSVFATNAYLGIILSQLWILRSWKSCDAVYKINKSISFFDKILIQEMKPYVKIEKLQDLEM